MPIPTRRHLLPKEPPDQIKIPTNFINQSQHLRRGAIRLIHRHCRHPLAKMILHLIKETHVASTPSVNRLLLVPHNKETSFTLTGRFGNERLQTIPLGRTGVLKFIEEPMVITAIKTKINLLPLKPRFLIVLPSPEKILHIIKTKHPTAPHLTFTFFIDSFHQKPHAFTPLNRRD